MTLIGTDRAPAAPASTEAGVSFGHGTTNAFDEAAWLVLWRLGLPLDDARRRRRARAVARRAGAGATRWSAHASRTRKPAAYLTGEAWLQGVPFYVDERAIVPRAYRRAAGRRQHRPLAGRRRRSACSTCAPATAAWRCWRRWPAPTSRVDAADISPMRWHVARINVDRHALAERITLLQGDGLAGGRPVTT